MDFSSYLAESKENLLIQLEIRDSQVLAKLGVVTIIFIGWGGGGV